MPDDALHTVPEDPSSRLLDPKRLRALHGLGVLDTPAEEIFDRMTRLAAAVMGVPVSFISLVDADRDFYKSQTGLPEPLATERQLTGRTFCHYTLQSAAPLVLDDVTDLPVFQDVPTVRTFGIRSYLGVPMRTADGDNIGSFCAVDIKPRRWTAQDVQLLTELAHSAMREIELRGAIRVLQATDRRKDVFVATLAHELRQPLAALVPAVELMYARTSESSAQHAYDVSRRQVKQLQRFVDDLTDVARIAGSKVVLHRERLDLGQIVRGAVDGVGSVAEQRTQRLEVVAPTTPVWIDADAGRLHQVFSNLLTNAIKFTPVGGSINATLEVSDRVSIVTVRDSGQGIAADALPYIFDLFMQEGTEQRAGLGIGLHLVRGLIELHGGTIEARSDGRARGSEFIVTLPSDAP